MKDGAPGQDAKPGNDTRPGKDGSPGHDGDGGAPALLGAAELRSLARRLGVAPRRARGQNFVVDANTVRRIAVLAGVQPGDRVLEVGPGLGSLTLALLAAGAHVTAVEVDRVLADALTVTVLSHQPQAVGRLAVIEADAVRVGPDDLRGDPVTRLVANLPYNVAVPVLLGLLERLPGLTDGLVMVQAEVGHRLAAAPGSRVYGIPSVKAAWWAKLRVAGNVARSVFWPAPHVDSVLVAFARHAPAGDEQLRRVAFAVVDAAFAQRRKTLRAALAGLYGSAAAAAEALVAADVDPGARGETLSVTEFARLARVAPPPAGLGAPSAAEPTAPPA